jgi:hypothetical protein
LDNLRKPLQVHFGVQGGRLDRSMAQHGRNLFEPDILTQHLTRGGMSEDVGTTNWRLDSGTLQGSSGDMGDRMPGLSTREGLERCHRAQEDLLAWYPWPRGIEIPQ